MNPSAQESSVSLIRIVPSFYPFKGGLDTDVKELSEHINMYINKHIIVAPNVGNDSYEFDKNYPIQIIRVKYPHIDNLFGIPTLPLNQLSYMLAVYRVLSTIKSPYIIQAHGISIVAFSSMIGKIKKIPVVGMLHGTTEAYSRLSGLYETILSKLFKPDYALVVDSGTRAPEKFRRLWGDRTITVNHGIDTDFFCPKNKNIELLNRLNLSETDTVILSISSLSPIKNIDLAIESIEMLIADSTKANIKLLIAGEGKLKENLIMLVDQKGLNDYVKFLGHVDISQMSEYISIADICIGMSLKDNMNRSILEPMACGKAILAFDGGSIEELIIRGHNGFLAKRGNLIDFTDKLKRLCEEPELREEVGRNARDTILLNRSWDVLISKQLSIYNKYNHNIRH